MSFNEWVTRPYIYPWKDKKNYYITSHKPAPKAIINPSIVPLNLVPIIASTWAGTTVI